MRKQLLMAYYGDDFTGSTDALEALSINGVKTVLLTAPPTDLKEILEQVPGVQCIGVAGTSRSMKTSELAKELREVYRKLQALDARIVHYKICSTGDSSPDYGSVGKAIEIGKEYFNGNKSVPLLVGVPRLGRYTVFSNHFAAVGANVFRLDRHPVMMKHPITPMKEADLAKHFGKQTSLKINSISVLDLDLPNDEIQALFQRKMREESILLFDALYESHLQTIGKLWWSNKSENPLFVTGSSGVQYAIIEEWKSRGLISSREPKFEPPGPVEKTVILSGSRSFVTSQQIQWALENGFIGIKIPIRNVMDPIRRNALFTSVVNETLRYLDTNRSVVIYSSMLSHAAGLEKEIETETEENIGKELGRFLGDIALSLIKNSNIRRLAFAGGDTSGYATQQLGVTALQMVFPTAKGAPLCRCYAKDERLNGMELALKGGQLGQINYFGRILYGN